MEMNDLYDLAVGPHRRRGVRPAARRIEPIPQMGRGSTLSEDTAFANGDRRKNKDGTLTSICWCGGSFVSVPIADVRNGFTVPCGRAGCVPRSGPPSRAIARGRRPRGVRPEVRSHAGAISRSL